MHVGVACGLRNRLAGTWQRCAARAPVKGRTTEERGRVCLKWGPMGVLCCQSLLLTTPTESTYIAAARRGKPGVTRLGAHQPGGPGASWACIADTLLPTAPTELGMYCLRCLQEQAWSDKIRRASTWWTWGLMGLHFASFVAVYTFLEPRKRQALTDAVSSMLQQHTARIDNMLARVADAVPAVTAQAVSDAAHRSATDRKQQQQQQLAAQAGQQGLAAAAEVQQKVLQQLESVQQQLQALAHAQQQQQQGQLSSARAGDKKGVGRCWWFCVACGTGAVDALPAADCWHFYRIALFTHRWVSSASGGALPDVIMFA